MNYKIIDVITKCAHIGPFYSSSNIPLLEKLGFQCKLKNKKPKYTKNHVWIHLPSCNPNSLTSSTKPPKLWIKVNKKRRLIISWSGTAADLLNKSLETMLALNYMPIPDDLN